MVAIPCLVVAAGLLVVADVFDAPALAVLGCAAVIAVLAARESWLSRGHGGQWIAMLGVVVGVIAVAFAASVLAH